MEFTKEEMLALFERRLSVESDINTHINIRLLDTVAPPRAWGNRYRRINLEWIGGESGWAVAEWRDGQERFEILHDGCDYVAAAAVFEYIITLT